MKGCWCRLPVTRRVPLVVQKLNSIPEHLSAQPIDSGVPQSLIFCVVLCRSMFVLFLASVLVVFLRSMTSDFPFDISLFLLLQYTKANMCDLMQRFNKGLLFFYEATFKKKTTSSFYYIPYWEYVTYIAQSLGQGEQIVVSDRQDTSLFN
jgi:hypothetical protein